MIANLNSKTQQLEQTTLIRGSAMIYVLRFGGTKVWRSMLKVNVKGRSPERLSLSSGAS